MELINRQRHDKVLDGLHCSATARMSWDERLLLDHFGGGVNRCSYAVRYTKATLET
jgi:hypothetical protein